MTEEPFDPENPPAEPFRYEPTPSDPVTRPVVPNPDAQPIFNPEPETVYEAPSVSDATEYASEATGIVAAAGDNIGGSISNPGNVGGEPLSRQEESYVTPVAQKIHALREQIDQVFIGQEELVDHVLLCLLCSGHVLIEGNPGLGKTHLVLALAKSFGGVFSRIQFTPDLMPADVTGHTIYDMGSKEFHLKRGPVFCNLLLADEINRAPAKTQSALLEVMQEQQVTIDGSSMPLDRPFMVLATQNPIEQEGTYALPEAQLDRFLMKIDVSFPEAEDEADIVKQVSMGIGSGALSPDQLQAVCSAADIIEAQKATADIEAVPSVVRYAVDLVRATREASGLSLGAGTRGAIALVRAAKARALLDGRRFIIPDDVKQLCLPVLRHRVAVAPQLAISGQGVDETLEDIMDSVEAPRS